MNLIERLQRASHEFHRWWPEQDVSLRQYKAKRFEVAGVGAMELEQSIFLVEEAPDMRLVVYTPTDDQSARKVALLQRKWKTAGGRRAKAERAQPETAPPAPARRPRAGN